ncbi:acyl-CoA dehydrogenase family protein [Hoyosella sp. G463]|uniref:Acyl-CoA dehydrogenase family protein n=1 Tax=Lolliginicoccus lacisalsi TaxID=2742202 RepID=A0A927J915_9ACTN|nr:acyl-CoA dehydrogenase family protein [Lolliginicoccus lacisalsi]MBD8504926.1 acyl-CoA dehydrogenase family protein [Lolliginicoccus lacisalsi]
MFVLDDADRDILATVEDFARARIAPHALDWDQRSHFPVDVLREAGALGMGGITVREDHGGAGLARLDAVRIYTALARACPTIAAFASIHNMVAGMIDTHGTRAQREQWLPRLCGMEALASYCLTEPGAGSDAAALSTTARLDGDELELTGTKQFISGAGTSELYLVMARTGGDGPRGISAILVPAGTPGLSFGADERKMGWHAQPTRQVILDRARVPAGNMLGEPGQGFAIAMSGLDGGRLGISACSLGGAEAALEATVRHARERIAFGEPLAERETVQATIARMRLGIETSRSILWRAASALDRGDPDRTVLCAMAKHHVTETCYTIADQALQLHGGYGYLADYGIEKIVRDLRVHRILEGASEIMHRIIARDTLRPRTHQKAAS